MVNPTPYEGKFIRRALPFLVPALFVLPIVVYWIYFHLINRISPYFERYDPEFAYLMNSLEVFKGHPYAYVDHPGTPVEVIGTLIYALLYPVLRMQPDAFVLYNLQHPGLFLYLSHAFLALASIVCVFVFVRVAARTQGLEDLLTAAALAMLYFIVHPSSLLSTSTWSHNTFAFPFGTLLLIFTYRYLKAEEAGRARARSLIALGIANGIFAAFTVIFASWGLGIGLALIISTRLQGLPWRRTLQTVGIYVPACILGFVLAVLPAAANAGYFFPFLYRMLTNQGRHGSVVFLKTLSSFVQYYPVLAVSIVVLLLLLVIAWWRRGRQASQQPATWSLALGLAVQLLALLAMILWGRDNQFYILAVAAMVPTLAFTVLEIYQSQVALRRMLIVLVAVGLALSLRSELIAHDNYARYAGGLAQEEEVGIQRAKRQLRPGRDLVVVYSLGTFDPCVSLWHGNAFTGEVFNADLAKLCPNEYLYFRFPVTVNHAADVRSYRVRTPQGALPPAKIAWDVFVGCKDMLSSPLLKSKELSVYESTLYIAACPVQRLAGPLIVAYRK